MRFDYSKLRGRIKEKYENEQNFSLSMNLSPQSLSSKLNNKRAFKQLEIFKACELLEIDLDEVKTYFFKN